MSFIYLPHIVSIPQEKVSVKSKSKKKKNHVIVLVLRYQES